MRQTTLVAALTALAVAAAVAGLWVAHASDAGSAAATYRTRIMDQREEGEVVVHDIVAIRIRSAAGGYSAAERARKASERLAELMAKDLKPDEVTTGTVNGEAAVLARGLLIVTADRFHAQINQTTPANLAEYWAHNLRRALEGKEPTPMTQPVAATDAPGASEGAATGESAQPAAVATATPQHPDYADWSAGGKKYVPIVSIGNPGVTAGAAQVVGPKEQVDTVKAVALLQLVFKGAFRMKVYVPVDSISLSSFHRVQGCSVAAFVDVKLLGF